MSSSSKSRVGGRGSSNSSQKPQQQQQQQQQQRQQQQHPTASKNHQETDEQEEDTGDHLPSARRRRPGPWPPRIDQHSGIPNPHSATKIPQVTTNVDQGSVFQKLPEIGNADEGSYSKLSNSTNVDQGGFSKPPATAITRPPDIAKPPGFSRKKHGSDKHSKEDMNGSKENYKGMAASPIVTDAGVPISLDSMEKKGRDRTLPANALLPIKMNAFGVSKEPQRIDAVLSKGQGHMKYELRESPGLVPLIFYGFQQYLSIAGSIILIPLIIVPAMGGSDEDTARVVSTVLLVTGFSTLMHTFLGSRLPLIQGASFVYLAPALTIINATEFQSIGTDRFSHTMRELQGAVIVASAFQAVLGYSGLMSILVRLINPVVVTPTVTAVGLAFFSYAFPVVGSCVEIGIPQILVLIIFTLYLRKISVFGHRIFQVFAVPLSLGIIWAYAFLLTAAGAYNYSGCSVDVPSSNIISDKCRKHVFTMMQCRTDVSVAMKTASWFNFPYPFQWGIPVFHWKTACIMIVASIIASIDSVGSYHASSLLVAASPPPPGVVSRAIGMEGLTSVLAGLWGIGTGATTLTENVHTIAVTKMGSRRAIEFGACMLILMSLVGKIGAFIALIPRVIVAALLCGIWSMSTAFGLSNLRYSETGSSRNVIIVGLSLFLSLSVPAYFQHYAAGFRPATVASYFLPYTVAAHGPLKIGIEGVDFVLNSILSMNMVIAFLVAFFLDNTVPGSQQERGTYVWTKPSIATREPAVMKDYGLPPSLAKFFSWAKWVGL